MTIEQVVDSYLQMAQQILGDPATVPTVPAPAATVAELPHPDWTGNAAQTAATAGSALVLSRLQLNSAATGVSAAAAAAARISSDATLQLRGIVNDWGAAKAAAATTPQPMRDAALIQSGQQHIIEAMGLISATAARYSAAAADVRAATGTLPNQHAPHPGADGPSGPSGGSGGSPSSGAGDQLPESPADIGGTSTPTPIPDAGGNGPVTTLAAQSAPAPMPAGYPPAAGMPGPAMTPAASMMPLQSMAGMAGAPMGSMPSTGSPLSTLGGLASQLTTNPTTTTGGDSTGDTTTRHHRAKPGSVDAAIDAALDELHITDPAARARWHAGYDTLIARESAGNSHAVNLIDRNAVGPIQADGAPAGASRGLTQITPENFRRYRLPSLPNDIYDRVANIAADMRYVMDRHHVEPSAINLTANVQQANPHLPAKGH